MDSIKDMKTFLDEVAVELAEAREIDSKAWYQTLVEYGDYLKDFPEEYQIPENKVKGCVSSVYIGTEFKNGAVYYYATSDVATVRGFLGIIIKAVNGLAPQDIAQAEAPLNNFLIKTNASTSLSPTRANAFGNAFNMIKEKAKEFLDKNLSNNNI